MDHVRNIKVGIYAGSFNPLHHGHMSIALKATFLFDEVIICQCLNAAKAGVQAPLPLEALNGQFKTHILPDGALLTDYVKQIEKQYKYYCDVSLIRGLRNTMDYMYEESLLNTYRVLDPSIKVVYFPSNPSLNFLSSSLIRKYPEQFNQYIVPDEK